MRLSRTVAAMALFTLVGCQPRARSRAMTETIGGAVRDRAFASATAYEALLRAEVSISRGEYEEASRQLELATFADDTDGWLCARRAEVLLLAGERTEALDAARVCARRFAEQAASWIVLGEALVSHGMHTEATAAFTRAMAAAPDDPEVRESVALGQGASRTTAAHARESASDARPSDRTIARRALLDEGRDRRPTLATLRRQRAREAQQRGAHSVVDALLTPLYVSQRATVEDRVAIIEARVADGRAVEAAPMVSALRAGDEPSGISQIEIARLWLLVGRAELAIEALDRAQREGYDNSRARRMRGQAMARLGRVSEALVLFGAIAQDDGEFVEAQIEAAAALDRAARSALGDRALELALQRVGGDPARAIDRDRLRVARARALVGRAQAEAARAVLASVETAWGRQQRGVLFALRAPSAGTLRDLRERSGDRRDDAQASAWLVLYCARGAGCAGPDVERALSEAGDGAAEQAVTLRARATRVTDAREAAELRRRAHQLDPLTFSAE